MEVESIFMFFDLGGLFLLCRWIWKIVSPTHHVHRHLEWRLVLGIALAISLAAILFVLKTWASFDVINDWYYILGYLSLGIIWITVAAASLGSFTDIHFQQDVRERNNVAASVAIGGLLIGSAIAYAGGNVGDGPGYSVVVFSALISSLTVYGSVLVLALATDGEERISIDHDMGSAFRFAGVAIGSGIIAGRAAAGNWVSVEATIADFCTAAWPVIPLTLLALIVEKMMPPSYTGVGVTRSALFFVAFVALSIGHVVMLGRW